MHTQCPYCRTLFRITPAQLDAAGGRVRCGHCRRIFDARGHLQKELPLEPGSGEHDAGAAAPGAAAPQGELPFAAARPQGISSLLLSDLDPEAPQRPGRTRRGVLAWGAVNVVLLVALFGQLLFAQREAFAQDPGLRPVLVQLCNLAGCTLPPRRAVERIELVRRNVYAHPNVDGALIIDATFVNNASFAQPYPVLTVSLGNMRGKPLIRRNFTPREYLPELDPNGRLAPGSRARVTLEVRDPGREARTFELDFS